MRLGILSLAAGLAIAVVPVGAHHSVAGAYDTRRELAVDGTVVEFRFVNPHPFMTLEVKTSGGVQRWKLEMDNRFELAEVGMTRDTFKPGERIIVRGNPAYGEPQTLYIVALERPADGFRYEQIDNSPRFNFKPR